MALVVKDRVKQTTTTSGTGSIVLNGAVDGFQTFTTALTDGDTTYYAIVEPSTNSWEVGLGTWNEGTTTLARTTVLASSNSNNAISLSGQAEVFITQPASKATYLNADGDLSITNDLSVGGTLTVTGATTLQDSVTVQGNLTVQGTTTTVEATNLAIADNMIYLNDGSTVSNPDLGWAGNYNDGTYAHAGVFRDASDSTFKFFDSYTPEPDASTNIDTAHASFTLAKVATGNLAVTGNITVSGTVDGRDIAADGTKLDGIEAGATADQTASEILTAIKTVDGAASGLDADLLDGQDGSYYLDWTHVTNKPDPTVTLSGDVSGSATMTDLGSITITTTVANDSHTHDGRYYTETEVGNFFDGTTAITGYNKTNWDTAYGWGNHASAGYLLSSSYTAADVLTKIKTVDGAASGLDADLLDGQDGSYYLDWTNTTNKPDPVITLTGAVTGSGTMTDLGSVSITTTATSDPTLTLAGDATGSATFTNLGNATLTVTVVDDSHNHIISNVDGLQTALDGKLNLSGGTLTGTLNYQLLQNQTTSNYDTAGDSSGFSVFYGTSAATNKPTGTDHAVATYSYSDAWQTQVAMDWRTKEMYFRTQENTVWKTWAKMWHSDNDGSGSGLDADLLDGIDSTQFVRSDANDTVSGQLNLTYGDGSLWSTHNGNSNAWYGRLGHRNSTADTAIFLGSYSNSGGVFAHNYALNAWDDLYINTVDGNSGGNTRLPSTTYIAGNTVWHAGNDGSGSGLDADLWDGNQFSTYLNQAVLTTSSPTFANVYVGDYVYHTGDTDTYTQFHAADQWRVVTGGTERFEINNSDVTVQSALKEKYVALSGTTPSIDVDAGGAFSLTTSGNTTFTFTAFTSGISAGFILQLTSGGSHTITWPASVDWAGGTAPDAPASGETDIYVFWSRDGGTTWYGVQSIDAAA